VFADAVTELEVLMKHRTEGEGYRLKNVRLNNLESGRLAYFEKYVRSWRWSGDIREKSRKLLGISKFKANATLSPLIMELKSGRTTYLAVSVSL
jgi:hypothetical protein